MYKEVWEAAVGEVLICEGVSDNVSDKYAVAVKKEGDVIGHLPQKLSKVYSLFLRRGGAINYTVIGHTII